MSFLRSLLSPSYRRAVMAEAAANYIEAARLYALCGLRDKVAEMHLLEAERLGAPDTAEGRLRELRAAVHWIDESSPAGRDLLARVARAYVALLRQQGDAATGARERQLCREAAQLALRAGDPVTAGEAYELLGDRPAAAEAYKEAGEVERMEALLRGEERRERTEREERDLFERYRMHLCLGQRDEALAALRACVAVATDRAEAQRLLEDLGGRLLTTGRIGLRRGPGPGETVTCVGSFPLLLGRGPECHLVLGGEGISRCHASISAGPALPGAVPTFAVRDQKSRNGTTLLGLLISGELPLRGTGQIGLGEHCVIGFDVAGALLTLTVERGLNRGSVVWASPAPIALPEVGVLRFSGGRPYLEAAGPLLLNGQRVPQAVQLIRGDVIEVGGRHIEVIG